MPYVLQITWRADGIKIDALFAQYIIEYNPTVDLLDDTFLLTVTDDIEGALRFKSQEDAFAYRDQISPNMPVRYGKPNKPLPQQWMVLAVPFR